MVRVVGDSDYYWQTNRRLPTLWWAWTYQELKSGGFMLSLECDVCRRRRRQRRRRRRAVESSHRRRRCRSVQILSYCQKIRCRRFGVEFHGRSSRRSHPATKMSWDWFQVKGPATNSGRESVAYFAFRSNCTSSPQAATASASPVNGKTTPTFALLETFPV